MCPTQCLWKTTCQGLQNVLETAFFPHCPALRASGLLYALTHNRRIGGDGSFLRFASRVTRGGERRAAWVVILKRARKLPKASITWSQRSPHEGPAFRLGCY